MTKHIKLKSVTVRMYRPGLGDCFLLTFHGKQGRTKVRRHMLIDCGVLTGTKSESERLGHIVRNIQEETQGQLHTLVVTHEHADHLSGFRYHKQVFQNKEKFKIGNVWLGWTENQDDDKARGIYEKVRNIGIGVLKTAIATLKKSLEERKRTLDELKKTLEGRKKELEKLKQSAASNNKAIQETDKVIQDMTKYLAENGTPDSEMYRAIDEIAKFLTDTGMQNIKDIAAEQCKEPNYLWPSDDPIPWDDFGGVRFHVLGPPTDPDLLKKSDPPKTSFASGQALNQSTAFAAAVMHSAAVNGDLSDLDELFELCLPFDSSLGIPLDELQKQLKKPETPGKTSQALLAANVEFFLKYYGHGISLDDNAAGPEWRRIDLDWLAPAGSLALYLDGDINNTSLVLAIELGAGGKVMLFPGDAQYGNWKSWAETERGKDLLARTVFYKVGHHGSHNATLIEGGLNLMATAEGCQDLVAMIPVDIQKAKSKRWEFPDSALSTALINKTRGRMILTCEGEKKGEQAFNYLYYPEPPAGSNVKKEIWDDFLRAINADWCDAPTEADPERKGGDLWVEYTLSL